MSHSKFILWFDELNIKQVPQVGGKNASLGEMYRNLTAKGLHVPNGFATTASAFQYFLKTTGLDIQIKKILKGLNPRDIKDLAVRGQKVRSLIANSDLPAELEDEVARAYHKLSAQYKSKALDVAVRSSATAEDLPTASFAGQMESFLNVHGEKNVLKIVKKCYASLYTDRAIVYRVEKGFSHTQISLSAGIQKMVRSDLACSGVMFSVDSESGFSDVTVINSSWGLGENIVQGKVTPDEFRVFEPLLDHYRPIIGRQLGLKEWRMIYDNDSPKFTRNLKTTAEEQNQFTLTDDEVLRLAKYSVIIEKHYKRPMDIEWAKDGKDGKLYIVQARPETVQSQKNLDVLEEYRFVKKTGGLLSRGKEREFKNLVSGIAVGSRIASGEANVIMDVKDIEKFKPGQILVTEMTDPDWVPIMKIAKAIVTNAGGRVCHAAIVSRELGIPCVVGTGRATDIIKKGQKITVSCAEGADGHVYDKILPFKVEKTTIKNLARPRTKIMLNVGEPEQAFNFSFIPNDGVGLAREEFIINNSIRVHPLALINYQNLKDQATKKQIDKAIVGYDSPTEFYINKLAEGIGQIAAAFYPKTVILRLADFKSNEYANLIGGKDFEPTESNPMIGWRGASRYYDPLYRPAFDLECRAIKKVRHEFGLDNLVVMVPFCRTPEEGRQVIAILDEHHLREKFPARRSSFSRSRQSVPAQKPLQIYVMCEIPSNVLMAEEFAKIFDGFSIGSNDLTQLILGLDRDSSLVAHLFDERNAAVKNMIRQIISAGKKYHRKVGICGQAPSDFPDFAEFLVEEGIDSISLNPDTAIKTTLAILEKEKHLKPVSHSRRARHSRPAKSRRHSRATRQ